MEKRKLFDMIEECGDDLEVGIYLTVKNKESADKEKLDKLYNFIKANGTELPHWFDFDDCVVYLEGV